MRRTQTPPLGGAARSHSWRMPEPKRQARAQTFNLGSSPASTLDAINARHRPSTCGASGTGRMVESRRPSTDRRPSITEAVGTFSVAQLRSLFSVAAEVERHFSPQVIRRVRMATRAQSDWRVRILLLLEEPWSSRCAYACSAVPDLDPEPEPEPVSLKLDPGPGPGPDPGPGPSPDPAPSLSHPSYICSVWS